MHCHIACIGSTDIHNSFKQFVGGLRVCAAVHTVKRNYYNSGHSNKIDAEFSIFLWKLNQNITLSLPSKNALSMPSAIHIANLLFQSVSSSPIPTPSTTPTNSGFPLCSKIKVRLLAMTERLLCSGSCFSLLFLQLLCSTVGVYSAEPPCLGPLLVSQNWVAPVCSHQSKCKLKTCPSLLLQLLTQCLLQIGCL